MARVHSAVPALVLPLLAALGCSSDEGLPAPGDRADDLAEVVSLEVGEPEAGFEVDVSDGTIDGDILTVTVVHGGGCGEHNYRMYWDGSILESNPPQARLVIRDETEDLCEALIVRQVRFNIGALRESFVGDATVILGIENYAGDPPVYKFSGTAPGTPGITRGNMPRPADPFNIDSATIYGTELEVVVSYSGGCQVHEFELFWDGKFLESIPLQVGLELFHNANDDFCESFRIETLRFDLTELGSGDPLIVNLQGTNGATRLRLE